ncbi:MAG: hypothetical protein GEEBNDBF_00777 [bacterium]|nr:hypothetical protein [bacterium]
MIALLHRGAAVLSLLWLCAALTGCGGRPQSTSPDALRRQAKQVSLPLSTTLDLFSRGAPLEDWQIAFQATPDDMELFEAFAYRQLLRGVADSNVEEALRRVAAARMDDPFVLFLQVYQMQQSALNVRADQKTRLETVAAYARDTLQKAQQRDPGNAFYPYMEATFWMVKGEMNNAWLALEQGNKATEFHHPCAAPLPRDLRKLEGLVQALGPHLGIYFQTTPRFFLTEFHKQLRSAGNSYGKDPVISHRILQAGRRQLEMLPFDLVAYQGALGLNKGLWEQQQQAGNAGAAEVLTALAAFEKPLKEVATATDQASRKLKSATEDPQLQYGAEMLALTLDFQANTASLHRALLNAIDQQLPAAPGS